MTDILLRQKKLGFIGCGNIAQATISALLKSKQISPKQIWISNRSEGKLKKVVQQLSVNYFLNNEQLVHHSDIVFLAIKPQDLTEAVEPISSAFHNQQLIVSLVAGWNLSRLQKLIPETPLIVRAMANTPAFIQEGVVGYCYTKEAHKHKNLIQSLLTPLGKIFELNEEECFSAFTVGASSGVGFLFELMIYWQHWLEEHGLSPETAKAITIGTFKGSSLLAESNCQQSLTELKNQVSSKKGVTEAGLKSMVGLEIERALRISFEKAVLRNNELDQGL